MLAIWAVRAREFQRSPAHLYHIWRFPPAAECGIMGPRCPSIPWQVSPPAGVPCGRSHRMDPVTLEVVYNSTAQVAHELTVKMMRTGYSTIIKESGDVTFAICDRDRSEE